MTNLEYLDLSNNSVWGDLSQACGLSKTGFLEQIALARNNISGSIPGCLLGLKNLVELRLDGNALRGSLPAIQGAKSSKLVYLTAANQVRAPEGAGRDTLAIMLMTDCVVCSRFTFSC